LVTKVHHQKLVIMWDESRCRDGPVYDVITVADAPKSRALHDADTLISPIAIARGDELAGLKNSLVEVFIDSRDRDFDFGPLYVCHGYLHTQTVTLQAAVAKMCT
jgi:hypothetical protein